MQCNFSDKVLAWYEVNGRKNLPWKVNDPYKIWISEIMLQQTQVTTVIPYYLKFIKKYPNILALSKASLDDLLLIWSGLGYYRRVKNIHSAIAIITKKYNNKFPSDFDEILSLPGIGKTTASAIATFSGFSNKAILDGNVKRILKRFFNINDNIPQVEKELWSKSLSVTPLKQTSNFIQGMMDIGSLVCTRTKPNCNKCPLKVAGCSYKHSDVSLKKINKSIKEIDMKLAIIINTKNQIYLEKITVGSLWIGLHSSPSFMIDSDMIKWISNNNLKDYNLNYRVSITHRVTNKKFKINSLFYFLKNDKKVSLSSENWYNLSNINVGMPKYQQKVLEIYRTEYENIM